MISLDALVYYSWGGDCAELVRLIESLTGLKAKEVRPLKPYGPSLQATIDRAAQEQKEGGPRVHPLLLDNFDRLILVAPNWFGGPALPMRAALRELDTKGKKLVAIISHGGGGAPLAKEMLTADCPEAIVEQILTVKDGEISAEELKKLLGFEHNKKHTSS